MAFASRARLRSARFGLAVALALAVISATPAFANPPLVGVTSIDAGSQFACAVAQQGTVQCWGGGTFWGELARSTPGRAAAPVEGLSGTAVDVTAGSSHACAVAQSGALHCWGSNQGGQLGSLAAGAFNSQLPVAILGLSSVVSASAGDLHTCAVTSAGLVRCLGANGAGQLGDGTTTASIVPVTAVASGATRVSAGTHFNCALVAGAAKCWGEGSLGQLGDGAAVLRTSPVQVMSLAASVVDVSAGHGHACAVTSSGGVKCWGQNDRGQLGDGTLANRFTPVDVLGLGAGIVAVSTGFAHTCALRNDGAMFCWGENGSGQLGDGTTGGRAIPGMVVGLGGPAVEVSTGISFTCARLADGTVRCFGSNQSGAIGNNSLSSRFRPVAVEGGETFVSIDAASAFTCGVSATSAVKCWGSNEQAQLGDGSFVSRPFPSQVVSLTSGAYRVSGGFDHACSVSTSGRAQCWGSRSNGALGDGLTGGFAAMPVDVTGLASNASAVEAGAHATCAVVSNGAQCWGANHSGQLGTGDVIDRSTPAQVVGLATGVQSVALGPAHACALRSDGSIRCWGNNGDGQLGDGTLLQRLTGVDVVGIHTGATAVTAGSAHTCAIVAGGARCWGSNSSGQLGIGAEQRRTFPLEIPGLTSGVVAIAAGGSHTCALTAGGAVHCWGYNVTGAVGPIAVEVQRTPFQVPLPAAAAGITAGDQHSCARLQTGPTHCWGAGGWGALGSGDTTLAVTPTSVVVGDFDPQLTLMSSPSPSNYGGPVRIEGDVTYADTIAVGVVTIRDETRVLCEAGVTLERFECSTVLTPGVHTLHATYQPYFGAGGAVTTSIQHVVNVVAGQHCAGFDDVAATDALCRSVEWVRNRGITVGCVGFDYCPASAVNRLAMAAFMNRLGRAMGPYVVTQVSGTSYLSSQPYDSCWGPALSAVEFPRRAYIDATLSGSIASETEIEAYVAAAQDFGSSSVFASGPPARITVAANRFATLRVTATVDIAAGIAPRFFLYTKRTAGTASNWETSSCVMRMQLFDREAAFSPYDRQP
jgi:alpha-tubulin suppressor-like RCC1 family protein